MLLKGSWKQRGLVGELLLLISGLAAMAIPSYIDYQNKAKVLEGLSFASVLRVEVEEYYLNFKAMPRGSTREIHQELGLAEPQMINGRYVESVSVSGEGRIRVQFRPEVFDKSAIVLEMTSHKNDAFFTWACVPDSEDTRFLRALPPECRN